MERGRRGGRDVGGEVRFAVTLGRSATNFFLLILKQIVSSYLTLQAN